MKEYHTLRSKFPIPIWTSTPVHGDFKTQLMQLSGASGRGEGMLVSPGRRGYEKREECIWGMMDVRI